MKSLKTIFRYVKKYPGLVATYFAFNILSALFSVFSLGLLGPFLLLLFKQGDVLKTQAKVSSSWNPISRFSEWFTHLLNSPGGTDKALTIICLVMFCAILLKTFFSYLSNYFLNPIRNRILNDMRSNMYHKILQLPISYFNEQRKGDIMSKLSNDLNDVEGSTVSVLESIFREPVVIILSLGYMIYLSPQLTLFLLIFLPISGFILGRIGRSLKKENKSVLLQFGRMALFFYYYSNKEMY